MHNGRGTGGQLAQLKNIEQLQIIAATKSRHLTALDTATQGDEVNPMAPTVSQVPNLQTNIRLHPKPWLKSKVGGQVSDPQSPSTTSPTFKLTAPSQQFGFRLPDSALANTRNQGAPNQDVDSVSNSSGPPSSQASLLFSRGASGASTPTSRAPSIFSSAQGDQDIIPHTNGRSSHLRRLAIASQSGIEAPARISHASSQPQSLHHSCLSSHQPGEAPQFIHHPQQFSCSDLWGGKRQSTAAPDLSLPFQESSIPPSLCFDKLNEPDSLLCPPDLCRTASFYTPLDGYTLQGHSLFTCLDQVDNNDDNVEVNLNGELDINERSPSEDDRFTKAVI